MSFVHYAKHFQFWAESPSGKTHLTLDPHWPRTKCGVRIGHPVTGWRVTERTDRSATPDTGIERCRRCYQI